MYRLILCLVLVTSTLVTPREATAAITDFYDTIDSAEVNQRDCGAPGCPVRLTVRGIRAGTSVAGTGVYTFNQGNSSAENVEAALHCHRLAVLVMSRPGKFQFGIGNDPSAGLARGCRLTLVTP
jgi:hypothetical protein